MMKSWGQFRRRHRGSASTGASVGLTASMMLSGQATADPGPYADVGAYLSWTFGGGDGGGFGWGIQGRGYVLTDGSFCEYVPFVGATARFGFVGWDRPHLLVTAQG